MVVHIRIVRSVNFGFTRITSCTSTVGINDNNNNNVTIVIGCN